MVNPREPMLQPIPILSLRPTQMTVGLREVEGEAPALARAQIEEARASCSAST